MLAAHSLQAGEGWRPAQPASTEVAHLPSEPLPSSSKRSCQQLCISQFWTLWAVAGWCFGDVSCKDSHSGHLGAGLQVTIFSLWTSHSLPLFLSCPADKDDNLSFATLHPLSPARRPSPRGSQKENVVYSGGAVPTP